MICSKGLRPHNTGKMWQILRSATSDSTLIIDSRQGLQPSSKFKFDCFFLLNPFNPPINKNTKLSNNHPVTQELVHNRTFHLLKSLSVLLPCAGDQVANPLVSLVKMFLDFCFVLNMASLQVLFRTKSYMYVGGWGIHSPSLENAGNHF